VPIVGTGGWFTVILRIPVVAPPELVAVTVKLEAGDTVLGVPVMMPVDGFRLRPAGSPGDTE
jgi:hypothetical protein